MNKLAASLIALAAISSPTLAEEYGVYNNQLPFPTTVDWNGFYVGITGGGGGGKSASQSNVTVIDISGGSLGLRAGFDMQMESLVVGGLATVQIANIYGSGACGLNVATCEATLDSIATLEARVGFAADKALAYIKGGIAYGHGSADTDPFWLDYYYGDFGWTIGAGMEVEVIDNVTVFAEYSYLGLLPHTIPAATLQPASFVMNKNAHLINAGINYRF